MGNVLNLLGGQEDGDFLMGEILGMVGRKVFSMKVCCPAMVIVVFL